MNELYVSKARDIINHIAYATLATVTPDGKPWNSPVYFIRDAKYCFYWFSDKANQHSQNIRHNGDIFIVIYDSTAPAGSGEGVYIQATGHEMEDPEEIVRVRKLFKGEDYVGTAEEFQGEAIRRVYKAVLQAIWMNDSETLNGKFIRDYRVEIAVSNLLEEVS